MHLIAATCSDLVKESLTTGERMHFVAALVRVNLDYGIEIPGNGFYCV